MHANKYAEPVTALGLMSGTSLDGVDIALIETDGHAVQRFGPVGERPFTLQERDLLRGALADAQTLTDRHARPGRLAEAEAMITDAYAETIRDFLAGRENEPVAVVGVHGQTVLHRPKDRLTVQLIDADALARRCGLTVVHDLRGADVAAGGQGAPLVPVFHQALARAAGLEPPVAVVNVGGVANVTWIGESDALMAFDTGPGNALLDDWVYRHTGEPMDRDGALAASGAVDERALAALEAGLSDYLAQQPPKSLDRLDLSTGEALEGLSLEDGAATLSSFTARCVASARDHLPEAPKSWIVCGGGARNPELLRALTDALPGDLTTADALGWRGDFIEAQAFAFLAARSLQGMPITFPGTTGVPRPLTGGSVTQPERAA
ncbi:anhydro-N-acetylmuramic acid kinase [Dichotomicrobium thermohalophilum]|uniref:Anhydro-N-acetylmuramic acid kinase n=1 Tax=Dichotomicrobium thermohalophilum TaxID=933063 RepID=A0A397Q4K6_9HYPH|nr:anhydro-N-acetylmuramic acid kinase [Dichotomicrobium thermohalophilum]RIA56266.1 anhydro-N-acetylmuramic acid kinase [Dichotomicrobium thermohalophilum]